MRLFSNRSQMTSKCGNNKKVAHEAMSLPHFDVFYDLLLDNLGYYINLDITLTLREISHINARPCIIISLSNDPVFNNYLLFAGREVRIEPRSHFFSTIWTDPKPANNLFIFSCDKSVAYKNPCLRNFVIELARLTNRLQTIVKDLTCERASNWDTRQRKMYQRTDLFRTTL